MSKPVSLMLSLAEQDSAPAFEIYRCKACGHANWFARQRA
jgi:hypothetical protein